jgi:peroxiredoxin
MLGIDEMAPSVVLVTHDGHLFDLGLPGQHLVVFFFEDATSVRSANTAGDFNDNLLGFRQLGVQVIGVGIDRAALVESFASGLDLRYPLVSDAERNVSLAFGMVGTRRGRPRAATFLIDSSGLVRRVFPEIPPYGHARDVLNEAEYLWGGY